MRTRFLTNILFFRSHHTQKTQVPVGELADLAFTFIFGAAALTYKLRDDRNKKELNAKLDEMTREFYQCIKDFGSNTTSMKKFSGW